MEWLGLVKSISVFSSDYISVGVRLSLPRSFVEQLRIGLESTCDSAVSICFSQLVIKLTFINSQLLEGVWFAPVVWI